VVKVCEEGMIKILYMGLNVHLKIRNCNSGGMALNRI